MSINIVQNPGTPEEGVTGFDTVEQAIAFLQSIVPTDAGVQAAPEVTDADTDTVNG